MKYIDADKLKTELNKRIELLENGDAHSEVMKRIEGIIKGYKAILTFIDSIQQEQPESSNGKFVFPNFLYARTVDNKTIDVSYAPQSLDAVEYIKNDQTEQPEVDLEKVARYVYESWMGGTMDDVRRDMVELGKILNARKEK